MAASRAVKAQPASNGHKPARKRVTFVITQELDDLLEVFCNSTRNPKNQIAQEAITEHLANRRKELEQALRKSQAALQHLSPVRRRRDRARV